MIEHLQETSQMAQLAKFLLLNSKVALQQTSYPTRQAIRLSKLAPSLAKLACQVWALRAGRVECSCLGFGVWEIESLLG